MLKETELFNLGKATSLGEEKLGIQISCTPLKYQCSILTVMEGSGKRIHA